MNNNIASKVLCSCLRTSCLGSSLTDAEVTSEVTVRHNATKGALKVTKTRLKDALEPFKDLRRQARRFFNSETLPGISDDLRLLPSARAAGMREKIDEFIAQDQVLIDTLRVNLPGEIEKDRAVLGDRFDMSLYPSADSLKHHFSITLNTFDLPSGDYARITGLSDDAKAQMKAEHDAMLVQVGVSARNEVMRKMTELIKAIADKMSNPDVKIYRDSTFTNLQEYLELVPDLNITNDPILESLRKEAASKLNFSMDVVKQSEVLKAQAAASAKTILARFGQMGQRKLVA